MITVEQAQGNFFDRRKVIDAVGSAAAGVLAKGAGLIRTIARRSMRRRRAKAPRGKPPSSHAGQLRDLLFFSFDPDNREAVVGPIPFKEGKAPNLLEFGGETVGTGSDGHKRPMHYHGNPFMLPALLTAAPELPAHWANSVKGE